MRGFIEDSIIEEIRARADIVSVISEYVALSKAGRTYQALCPFHDDKKTPSFKVSEERQSFHCFGCQRGGDVFKFVQLREDISFPEAIRYLAERTGVEIPEPDMTPAQKTARSEAQLLAEINDVAAAFFVDQLNRSEQAGKYLEERGLGRGTIEKYRLGYAPNTWEALGDHLRQKKMPLDLAERAGLVRSRDRDGGGYYDVFRGRITFPILDIKGRTIGFGGRTLFEEDEKNPKYLNTPETHLYKKSHNLYGLYQARKAIDESGEVILVEGNVSLLTPVEAGFENVVAPLGTALTREQFMLLLRRRVKKIYVAFDGDSAGQKAAMRAAEMALEFEAPTYFLKFEKGFDPDDTIRKKGPDEFTRLIDEAVDIFDFIIETVDGRADGAGYGPGSFLELIMPYIGNARNPIVRDEFINRVSGRTGYVGPDSIKQQLDIWAKRKYNRNDSYEDTGDPREQGPEPYQKQSPEMLLAILYWNWQECRAVINNWAPFDENDATDIVGVKLLNALVKCYVDKSSLEYRLVAEYIDDEKTHQALTRLLLSECETLSEDANQAVFDCLEGSCGILSKSIKRRIKEARLEMIEAQKLGENGKVISLMHRVTELTEQLAKIQLGDANISNN